MSDKRYDVVFCGEVLDDFSVEQVKKKVAEHNHQSVDQIEPFFDGEKHILGKRLKWSDAKKHLDVMAGLGARVYLTELPDAPEDSAQTAAPQAEPKAPVIKLGGDSRKIEKTGRRATVRYRFDTFMARGGSSIFKALVMAFVSVFVVIGAARGLLQIYAPEAVLQHEGLDFLGNLYITFLQLTDPGNMAQDILSSPRYKIFSVMAGLSGVIMLSALIAFITTSLDQKISDLKRGHSKVIESGHSLILGWNEQRIIEVLRELILANESEKDACVVILSELDKEEMDAILRLRVPQRATTRIVTRSGSVSTTDNLDMVSVEAAKSIIILATCNDTDTAAQKAASDAMVIQIVLAATGKVTGDDEDFCIVAEIFNPTHRDIVESTFSSSVVTVNTSEILAKLLVQTSRSVGLSVVYNEILSFDGCEMYFYSADWGEISFAALAYHFPDGVPMGIRSAEGALTLNPPGDTTLQEGDEILILADDDSTIEYRAKPVATPQPHPLSGVRLEQHLERELILGWNHKAPIILREFADYVKEGSVIHILLKNPSDAQRSEIESLNAELAEVEISLLEADCLNRSELMRLEPFDYDNIIILAGASDSSDEGVDTKQVDSENIVTLLLLRSIFSEHPVESASTKLITEVLDSQTYPLVSRAGVKDVIISNRMVSMIMGQISEGRDIKMVYDDIFQEDGSEIYLKPVHLYFSELPIEVSFADMMAIANLREEVCIGVKLKALESDNDQNNGIQLIPDKNSRFTLDATDSLIVVAENEL